MNTQPGSNQSNGKQMTVAEYVVERLSTLGIDKAFGVPGDYSFPLLDAIDSSPQIDWIGCSNELNASYAADGYARTRGAAILAITYGVGELSTLTGLMSCKAHRVPVFTIVGAPSRRITAQRLIGKHTLGDGEYGDFENIMQQTACASAFLTPANAVSELERLIQSAVTQALPVYIVIPHDVQQMPILEAPVQGKSLQAMKRGVSVNKELEAALSAVLNRLNTAKNPVAIPTTLVARYGLASKLIQLIEKSNMPFAVAPIDKGIVEESHALYLGSYNGLASSPKAVKSQVEASDLILDIGGLIPMDFNTGYWTDTLPEENVIRILGDSVRIGGDVYLNVYIGDMLDGLIKQSPQFSGLKSPVEDGLLPLVGSPDDKISSEVLYPRLQRFLRENDTLVMDAGNCQQYINPMRLPKGVGFEHIGLWSSIGWATPATLGVALANSKTRAVCVTGDGAHQMSLNEIAAMGFYGTKPVIFVVNNNLYGCEITLSHLGSGYVALPKIEFHKLPEAFGCKDWIAKKVSTVKELDDVLALIQLSDAAAYVEVVTTIDEFKPYPTNLLEYLYKIDTPQPKSH